MAISDMEEFPLSVALRLGADAAFKAAKIPRWPISPMAVKPV
ncbi:MAG: hypothetical protein V8Q91_06040 [Bilophila wadsworthia]